MPSILFWDYYFLYYGLYGGPYGLMGLDHGPLWAAPGPWALLGQAMTMGPHGPGPIAPPIYMLVDAGVGLCKATNEKLPYTFLKVFICGIS